MKADYEKQISELKVQLSEQPAASVIVPNPEAKSNQSLNTRQTSKVGRTLSIQDRVSNIINR
jgi:hypothetical protein